MKLILSIACLSAAVSALPSSSSSLFESLASVPQGWTSVGQPAKDTLLNFKIAMSARNPGLFEQKLYQVSDPAHSSYGKHLKRSELAELLKPAEGASIAIRSWLEKHGVEADHISEKGEWLNFKTTVARAEDLLNTKFNVYHNKHAKGDKIRTLRYSVPAELHEHIDMIQPTTRFAQIKPQGSQVLDSQVLGAVHDVTNVLGLNDTVCNNTITPACLRDLYNVPINNGLNNNTSGFGAFVSIPLHYELC